MEAEGTENGVKLRRGRISLDRKREILEQYDLLSKPCSDSDAAALFGVTQATLAKILSERSEIQEAAKKPPAKEVDPIGSPKLSRGRLSFEKRKEILRLYDELPKCDLSEAAAKLGVRELTLTKLLASRRSVQFGKRKRKRTPSSSDSDDSNDALTRTPRAAAKASNRLQDARRSPQPSGSGISNRCTATMSLRKGRRVRVNFSEDEQSGSDFELQDSDSIQEEEEALVEEKKTRKHHTKAERMEILSKYDAMQPCTQAQAAMTLGVTQSCLCSWLKQRNQTVCRPRKSNVETDSDVSGEEIDSYVMAPKGSNNKAQVVQFFEVADDQHQSKSSNDSNPRKVQLSLKDKFELLKKYDAMDPGTLKDAAETLKLPRTTWQNLLANRYYFEERFKAKLRKDMATLNKYDAIADKTTAAKALGMTRSKLEKVLESRGDVEKYYNELITANEDEESIAHSIDEKEATWKDSNELKALEMELLHWFKQANNERTVSWKELKDKAVELASNSEIEDFQPSDSWLKKWNKTHRVFWKERGNLVAIYGFGENRNVSESLLTALKDYPPENVFNLVETGLYYRAVPGCSPLTDDWVVVAFACNMSGTEKKKLLVVGKSEAPLCFRVMSLPVTYKRFSNAIMTESIVTEHLEAWDRELTAEGRRIALVLDSSSSHPSVPLNRIRLFFVPAECTGDQPLSLGVVALAKSSYRQRMAETLQTSSYSTGESVTIVDALFALAEAWDKIPKELLVAKFLNSTFPQNDDTRTELDTKELEILNTLDNNIPLHSIGGTTSFDGDESALEGSRVVHMEGTLHLSDEEVEDFDIDSLLRDQDTTDVDVPRSTPDLGSKLKNFLGKTSTPNGSVNAIAGPPATSDVRAALSTIKRFLHHYGGTLEDLTDYAQLESKVLSKIKEADLKLS